MGGGSTTDEAAGMVAGPIDFGSVGSAGDETGAFIEGCNAMALAIKASGADDEEGIGASMTAATADAFGSSVELKPFDAAEAAGFAPESEKYVAQ